MRLQVGYISFSAHTDFNQTSTFIHALKPSHLVSKNFILITFIDLKII